MPQLTRSDTLRCGQDSLTNCSATLIQLSNPSAIRRLLSDVPALAAETITKQSINMYDISSSRVIDRKEVTRSDVIFEFTGSDDSGRATQWMFAPVKMGWDMGRGSHSRGSYGERCGADEWWICYFGGAARSGRRDGRCDGRILGGDSYGPS
jgi:hypothetical protein